MLLSSYERMRRYLSDAEGTALTDSVYSEREIVNWIASVSNQIEKELNRSLQIESRTEYFDTALTQVKFFIEAPPVISITSVKEDVEGLYDGSETTYDSDEYFISADTKAIEILQPIGRWHKALQMVYTGGLAYHGTRTLLTIESSTGTWTAGQYAHGGTSGALGIIRASTATTLTIETLFGEWEVDEPIAEYTDETHLTAGDASATISAVTQPALSESYPDIVRACEIQVRYLWKHKDSFELTSAQRDGTSYRRDGFDLRHPFVDEAMRLLLPYKRLAVI